MLWESKSDKNDGGEENKNNNISTSPVLVPLPDQSTSMEKNVPVLVPDVKDLKDQFQQQQNMILQLKKNIMQNESQLNSKEKQIEVYANKLSQIRARTKNTQGKKINSSDSIPVSPKTLVKRNSRENLAKPQSSNVIKSSVSSPKLGRKVKISELKKCLEENKIKFEERTGKQEKDAKKVEIMVEQLKTQLEERDKTIQELQKVIEQPKIIPKRISQKSEFVASKFTQTFQARPAEESNEILALQKKIYDLEANVLDLEENLKEKESVIEARTQAVTLLSQDLSLKGKSTLENLEDTRQEMRAMQNNFIVIENQLKKDITDRDNRLTDLEEKYEQLLSTNADMGLKNAELQEKLIKSQERYAESEAKNMLSVSANDDELLKKISVLTKELDDRNKAMIKMKIEHRNQLKSLKATLESLKSTSDDKAEIFRLSKLVEELEIVKNGLENRVAELEDEKGNHLLSVLDVDDLKATEKKLKDQINELEIIIQRQNEDLSQHQAKILTLEKEKSDLVRVNQDQNILIEDLYGKLMEFGGSDEDGAGEKENSKYNELKRRFENMKSEYEKRLEFLKTEHSKEIEMIECYYDNKTESSEKRELEEYRITTEINNIHVEEQIELLIREKQQLLEKLKALSGVSSTDSLAFEKVERLELKTDKEITSNPNEDLNAIVGDENQNQLSRFQKVIMDQQNFIEDLERSVQIEKDKVKLFEEKILEMNETIKKLEDDNSAFKSQLKVAESNVECGKIQKFNFNTKNKVKKIEMELVEAKKTLSEQTKKIEDLNEKLKEKEEIIQKYTAKIELFEKDDWDRQNHWKNSEEDIDNVRELQKKCLSLENSLIELNEQFEKLRKENIEVVHLLSEEKVKRKKLLEGLGKEPQDSLTGGVEDFIFEEKIQNLKEALQNLEVKVEALETTSSVVSQQRSDDEERNWRTADLEQKLEWSNVVLTSKETEIFRLQNLLEDRNKLVEDLELDLNEFKIKFAEKEKNLEGINELLKIKEAQLQEVCMNVQCLSQQKNEAAKKLRDSDLKFQNLLAEFKKDKDNLSKKTLKIQEMQGILQQKSADFVNLKTHLEDINNEMTKKYEDQIFNLNKCLKDKELDFEAVWSEKKNLETTVKDLMTEKEAIFSEKNIIANENGKLRQSLAEKEQSLAEVQEKLKISMKNVDSRPSTQDVEELKTKMKKLAANLKKKAQNENDLLKQLKDLEAAVAEKNKLMETMQININDATEKWISEKNEKEKVRNELETALTQKANLESECANLKEEISDLKRDLENSQSVNEDRVKQLEEEIQRSTKAVAEFQVIEQQYKDTITNLNKNLNDVFTHRDTITSTLSATEIALQKELEEKTEILKNVAEISNNYEKLKLSYDENVQDKTKIERKLEDLQKLYDVLMTEKGVFEAKLQENLAVIENLEMELLKAQNHIKDVEEKLFKAEERRLSLESKNEDMYRKITENSQNQIMIDDMTVRVDELLDSEKSLLCTVQNLESNNVELKRSLDESQSEIQNLKKEVETASEKVMELMDELKRMRELDAKKTSAIASLTEDINKKTTENKQILGEYDKLNRDYEQFEVDYKESLENSQNVEKSLRHCIEELTGENASLLEKLNLMMEEEQLRNNNMEEKADDFKKLKKKSLSSNAEGEMDYEDLKQKLYNQSADLKRANEEIEILKSQILQKKSKEEAFAEEPQSKVENLKFLTSEMEAGHPMEPKQPAECFEPAVQKAEAKSLTAVIQSQVEEEKKFDANVFFGSNQDQSDQPLFFDMSVKLPVCKTTETAQASEFDSLMWDDGWGTTENFTEEYLTKETADVGAATVENQNQNKIESLEAEIRKLKAEVEKLTKDLEDQNSKYMKALKKLKLQKVISDKLQAELESNKFKSQESMGDLNATIMEEFKSQIELLEKKEQEHLKTLQNYKSEKELLLKKIETLNVENEKFLEMKERRNSDVEVWQTKNKELSLEIAELREKLKQPVLPTGAPDDNFLVQQNRELMNRVEALEWKNSELILSVEEKEELLEKMATSLPPVELGEDGKKEKLVLQKEMEELKNVKTLLEKKLSDEENKNMTAMNQLNEQLTALTNENETLQDILGEMKAKGSEMNDSKIVGFKQKIEELESLCEGKDSEIKRLSSITMQLNEELNCLKQQLFNVQSERDLDINKYRDELCRMENILKAKEEEFIEFKSKHKKENEKETQDQFETVDLNQDVKLMPPFQNGSQDLKQKVIELEDLLKIKEESILMHYNLVQESNKEMGELKLKNSELEELVRSKQIELDNLRSLPWNNEKGSETVMELKEIEIQNPVARVVNVESFRTSDESDVSRDNVKQENFESILMSRENEFDELRFADSNEVNELRQRVLELENLLSEKSEEIKQLMARLAELEKNYNDSKMEIERLLNEEKLNTEEKFVEPFQNNMQIPLAFELEAMVRSLDEEKQKVNNLQYALSMKEKEVEDKAEEVKVLIKKVTDLENVLKMLSEVESRQRVMAEESYEMKAQLEKIITDLQKELDSSNLQLGETRRELEQYQNSEDEVRSKLKAQIVELERMLMESTEKKDSEVLELKSFLDEKTSFYEALLQSRREEEVKWSERAVENENLLRDLKIEIEKLVNELESKNAEISALTQLVTEERSQLENTTQVLESKEKEVMDLRQTLTHMQIEISNFRNFEKQVKELRMAQLKEGGSNISVTPEGNPDLSGWTEHELAELSTKLQSDLDTAMYMLHQRDVRCDELTFELMQLIEERDTLQLRLSTALRLNEELRSVSNTHKGNSNRSQEGKDLVDQANDRQEEKENVVTGDQNLADKISELHSTSYLRDKRVKDDSVQRHEEQMTLLSRISDSDVALGRDAQSPSAALLNWMRGKSTPKVMHI